MFFEHILHCFSHNSHCFTEFSDIRDNLSHAALRLLLLCILYKPAAFVRTHKFIALLQHDSAAPVASVLHRLLPHHKVTFRIVDTAVIFPALLRLLEDDVPSALRAGYADLLEIRLRTAARNLPWGPYLMTICLPHVSQNSSESSSAISTSSSSRSALSTASDRSG